MPLNRFPRGTLYHFAPFGRRVRFACLALAGLGLATPPAVFAQTGILAGQILDQSSGRPVQSAEVRIEARSAAVLSDVDGRFRMPPLPAGSYVVNVRRLGYAEWTAEGVVVQDGQVTTLNIPLTSSALQLEGIVIESERVGDLSSEAGLLQVRRSAGSVTDGISAEQISRAPDSNAGDAVARITGVSIVDDKFVVVRGLGERYSNTLLNGSELASPEPTKRIVPLDIFPAALIESLVTKKTATADRPGDFAGGSVEITTKNFPDQRVFQFSVSQGWNSTATFDRIGHFAPRFKDRFTFDGRGRKLDLEVEAGEQFAESLRNEWRPRTRRVRPNLGFSVNFGEQVGDFDRALGYTLSLDYGSGVSFDPENLFGLASDDTGRKATESAKEATTVSTEVGLVANLAKRLGPNHTLTLKNILTRDAEEFFAQGVEFDPEVQSGFTDEIAFEQVRYVTRTFWQGQLGGSHRIEPLLGSTFDWTGTLSLARRNEPENRTINYVQFEGSGLRVPDPSETNDFWFRFLDDDVYTGQVDWSIPSSLFRANDALIKIGGLARFKRRDFDATLLNANAPFEGPPDGIDAIALPPKDLLSPENVGRNIIFRNISPGGLPYTAEDDLMAGYAMLDFSPFESLRIVSGVRFEQWDLSLTPGDGNSQTSADEVTERSQLDILPSANLTWSLLPDVNARLGASRTVNRPDPRELANSPYAPVSGECTSFGNPDLNRAKITNFDARIEWFPSPAELISVGGFYKEFDDPVVQTVRIESLNCVFRPANARSATNFGLEFEVRKNLGVLADAFSALTLGANLTLVEGDVTPDPELFPGIPELPLQDQSPVLVNSNLAYDDPEGRFSASVLVNFFDDRVRRFGIFQGLAGGDTGRTPDIFERARTTLDAKLSMQLGNRLSMSISGTNLTNQNRIEFQESLIGDLTVGKGAIGTSISISGSYSR